MHSWEWTSFLKRINREPILMTDKIYSIGLKGLLLFGLLCVSSVEAIHNKKLAISPSLRRSFQDNIKVPMSSYSASVIQKIDLDWLIKLIFWSTRTHSQIVIA